MTQRHGKILRLTARVLLLAAFAIFLRTSFRTGWGTLGTDFPNYYTAAKALLARQPLRDYYDWTWFARRMNYAGVERQLGAYTPQTPLTMLPVVPLTGLAPLDAKRVWLVLCLALLAAVVVMLAHSTGVWWEAPAALIFCGANSLGSNFRIGQYYIPLLFLMTLTDYWLARGKDRSSGVVSGVTFALKLYSGPMLLYFAAKRKWTAVAGMLAGFACLGLFAIAWFGWSDILYYLTHVLPRTLEGGSIDPYNPGVPTISTFLSHAFLREPRLNPHPAWEAPWIFFMVRATVQLSLVVFTVLGIAAAREADNRRDFAWFVVALLLLSTSTAAYTYIVLLLPITLLLKDASPWKWAYLAATYILTNSNLLPARLFPKVWLLLLLYLIVGAPHWRAVRARWAICAACAVLAFSLVDAQRHMAAYRQEPGRRFPQIAIEPSLFSGYPAVTRAGIFYQAMGDSRKGQAGYVLRKLHDNRSETLTFDGYALRPYTVSADGPVWFELVAHGTSTTIRLDPQTGKAAPDPSPPAMPTGPVVSPDGKWAADTRTSASGEELWIVNRVTGRAAELAGGNCNNSSPAWELDSAAIIFASDCGRAFGLPALYRAPVAEAYFP